MIKCKTGWMDTVAWGGLGAYECCLLSIDDLIGVALRKFGVGCSHHLKSGFTRI